MNNVTELWSSLVPCWIYEGKIQVGQLQNISGLSHDTIQNWCNRGLIKNSKGNGKGNKRYFDSHTVARIAIALELMKIGLSTQKSFWIADNIWERFADNLDFWFICMNPIRMISMTSDITPDLNGGWDIHTYEADGKSENPQNSFLRLNFGQAVFDMASKLVIFSKAREPA